MSGRPPPTELALVAGPAGTLPGLDGADLDSITLMTELPERTIAKLQPLPGDRQDEAAQQLLSLMDGPPAVQLTTEQAQEVARRLDTPAPRYSNHEEVAAALGHKRMR